MNLVIDEGNTCVKLTLFDGVELFSKVIVEHLDYEAIYKFIQNHTVTAVILSTVKEDSLEIKKILHAIDPNWIQLSHNTPLPFNINYKTPETLGRDRIAAVAGAYFEKPNRNILVIDAGTAITFDFIDQKGDYLGGNIAPGLEMRLKSLHHFTDKLPCVDKAGDTPLMGYDTQTAIRSGVIQGMLFEIDGYIKHLEIEYPNLLVFLTGGDTLYFDKRLKNIIFADQNLVSKGLNRILQYNAK